MARPVTLCTLQWGDLPLEVICEKAKSFGFEGVELGLPSHLDVRRPDPEYYRNIKATLDKYGLQLFCISNHLVGQAICDNIDQRHNPYCLIISGETVIPKGYISGRPRI